MGSGAAMMNAEAPTIRLEVAEDGEREGSRATAAASELFRDLRKHLPAESLPTEDEPGAKGDPVTLISIVVALISAGAVTELVRCVRDWINRRPQRRSLVIRDAAGNEVITVKAENVDDATLAEALKTAARSAEA